jgi:hypothetical protein
MQRARLALAALASSLLLTAGCASMPQDECHSGGWLSRFRLASRTTTPAPCDCEGGGGAINSQGEGPVMVPPNAYAPNTFVAPPPGMVTVPPWTTQPPRIIPVPQANPMPYSPQ